MNKSNSKSLSEPNQTSFLLLDHIKDDQIYSTLSTITLQFAKEAGVEKNLINQLIKSFAKFKSVSHEPLLDGDQQNIHNDLKITNAATGTYDEIFKGVSFKQQARFLSKMETELVHSRQKQNCFQSLNKYAAQKQADLLPLLNVKTQTKNSKFKNLLGRKQKGKVCTSQDYFKLDTLDLLKNSYQNENECYTMMRNFSLLKTMFGHSMDEDPQSNCPLYNVLFDQSQKLIISGGQEGAIKIWSKQTGLLLSSLKGHQQYINKLEVTKCNKYICSSAGDGIRFFQLKDMTTFGGWKTNESIIEITSVYDEKRGLSKFLFGDKKNLYVLDEVNMIAAKNRMLTKDDFNVYRYSHKMSKQGFILNIQVSSDQQLVLIGFQFGDILLLHYKDLFTIEPIKSETQPLSNVFNLPIRHHMRVHRDEIRQLKWHVNNQYFVSGGKQGYCLLWEYKNEKMPVVIKDIQVSKLFNRRKKRAFGCNFIIFNCTNTHFIAGFMELVDEDDEDRGNGDVIAYSLESKEVIFQFSKDMPIKVASVRGMDTHPTYPNIAVVCEGTGRILILDFLLKTILNTFQLRGFHLLHPHFSLNPGDCRFSKDGRYFVVSTEFGSISVFGYDLKNFYEACSSQQFFANDFTSFTVNEKMEPIPIQGDLQIDMNQVERGEIRMIRGTPYEKQFTNNFSSFWKGFEEQNSLNPIQHKNSLINKKNSEAESINYKQYLEKLKYNLKQADRFNSFYSKNLEQIEATKQSLLYDEREKQSKVFKKIIQQKIKKMTGVSPQSVPTSSMYELTHNEILEQIDAKGKRGGRRLTKMNRQALPNYKDDFEYNSANEQQYNIEQQPQEEQLQQLDYRISQSSDDAPRITRRNQYMGNRRQNQTRTSRYNIRSRPAQRHYYNEEEEEEEKIQRTFKRRTPAEDVEQMLKDQTFKEYDMTKGRKKRKTNRMKGEDQDDDFIKDQSQESQFGNSQDSHSRRRAFNQYGTRRAGQTKKSAIPEDDQKQSSESPNQYSRLRKGKQNTEQKEQKDFEYEQKPSYDEGTSKHNLRTRHHDDSAKRGSKRQKQKDLGECYRCAVNPAVAACHLCESACCESCKQKRGKDITESKFQCYICTYIYSSGSAIVDQKKLSEEYFRLGQRSQSVYVPQIDDLVRFFFQGYQEFLAHNIKSLNIEPIRQIEDYLLMPHIYNQIYGEVLLQTPLCKVKDIRYFFPFNPSADILSNTYRRRSGTNEKKHINMLVNLQIVFQNKQNKKDLERTDFWVFFIPSPSSIDCENHYLLREQIYRYVEDNKSLQSLSENQTVHIYGQEYQIIEIGPMEDCFPESIWKQVKVSRSDGKRLRNMSKESQKRCNIWDISEAVPKIDYIYDYKPQQYQRKLLDKIKYIRQTVQDHEIFEDYVDFQVFQIYRKMVECGICLSSIEERIKNNYYHSLNGLQFDLDHMVKNSITFNGDSAPTQTAITIRKQILKVLNVGDEVLKKFNQKQEQESPTKREKRIVKKKQLDEGFIITEEAYGLRNQRSSRSKNVESTEKVEKKPASSGRSKRKISEQSFKQGSESQFNQKQDQSEESEVHYKTRRHEKRPQPQKQTHVGSRGDKSRNKKYDKVVQDYDKEEKVYKNIQNRRNRSRYLDSSYDSNEKNSGTGAYPTRRSSRLQH